MIDFDNIRKNTFQIGTFRVEPTRNLLKKDSQTFPLEPKIMDVLCELASYPGEVIARYDLIQRIWKVDYGADESLTRAISVLRKTFRSISIGVWDIDIGPHGANCFRRAIWQRLF